MRRTDLQGMTPEVYREKLRRDRALSPEERLRKTDELIVDVVEMRRNLDTDSLLEDALSQRTGEPDPFA